MILKTIRDMSQEKQSDVSATCVWVLLKLSKRRHFHWLKRTTDHKKAHFSESAALFAEILEKARLLLLKTTYLNLLQRYFNFRSTHSVQVSHHSDSESWWKHSDMLAILIWQFFWWKEKRMKKTQTLLPSIFMTGVHPPSPHPKSPMWQRTETGFSLMIRVTNWLTLSLSRTLSF